jgi:hypothetical protein
MLTKKTKYLDPAGEILFNNGSIGIHKFRSANKYRQIKRRYGVVIIRWNRKRYRNSSANSWFVDSKTKSRMNHSEDNRLIFGLKNRNWHRWVTLMEEKMRNIGHGSGMIKSTLLRK